VVIVPIDTGLKIMKTTKLNGFIARYLSAGGFLAIASLAAVSPVHATPILDGNSNSSTFSDLSCTSCADTSLTSTVVTFGTTASGGSDSLLTINDVNFSVDADTDGVQLAELSLYVGKKPGEGQEDVKFDYNLILTFLTPSGGGPSQTFSVGLVGNFSGGVNAEVTLSGFGLTFTDPLALSGVTLSNFRFLNDGTSGSFSNDIWTVDTAQSTAHLFLVADVTATTISNPDPGPDPLSVSVPEPTTISLFGIGLLGLTALRRRKQSDFDQRLERSRSAVVRA
jgi:hypothetical protein